MSYRPTFATEISNIEEFSVVYLTSMNGFPDAVANVITVPDNVTFISTKPIVLPSDVRIEVTDGGISSFQSLSAAINTYTANLSGNVPFVSGDIGRFDIADASFFSGTGEGNIFDFTSGVLPSFTVTHRNSLVFGFSAIGDFNGGTYLSENIGWVNNDAGITFTDMGTITMDEQAFRGQTGDHIIVNGTVGDAVFARVQAAPSTGDAIFNIDPAVDVTNKIIIKETLFDDSAGGTLFASGSLDQTNPRIRAFNNTNELDSYWIGSLGFKENATATVVVLNTYTDILGTSSDKELERFTRSGNILTYIGLENIKTNIEVTISASRTTPASSARTIRAAIFIDTGSGFVEQNDSFSMTMKGDVANFSFQIPATLTNGDIIKVQIKNEDTTDSILVVDYNLTVGKL